GYREKSEILDASIETDTFHSIGTIDGLVVVGTVRESAERKEVLCSQILRKRFNPKWLDEFNTKARFSGSLSNGDLQVHVDYDDGRELWELVPAPKGSAYVYQWVQKPT